MKSLLLLRPPINDDVLIRPCCIILKGVTIGVRSVIAAGRVVSKSIPADCIVDRNSAKMVRYRYDKETIEFLLKMKWWNIR